MKVPRKKSVKYFSKTKKRIIFALAFEQSNTLMEKWQSGRMHWS